MSQDLAISSSNNLQSIPIRQRNLLHVQGTIYKPSCPSPPTVVAIDAVPYSLIAPPDQIAYIPPSSRAEVANSLLLIGLSKSPALIVRGTFATLNESTPDNYRQH